MNRHEVAAVMLVWISTYRSGGRDLRSVVADMHKKAVVAERRYEEYGCSLACIRLSVMELDFDQRSR